MIDTTIQKINLNDLSNVRILIELNWYCCKTSRTRTVNARPGTNTFEKPQNRLIYSFVFIAVITITVPRYFCRTEKVSTGKRRDEWRWASYGWRDMTVFYTAGHHYRTREKNSLSEDGFSFERDPHRYGFNRRWLLHAQRTTRELVFLLKTRLRPVHPNTRITNPFIDIRALNTCKFEINRLSLHRIADFRPIQLAYSEHSEIN